MKSRIVILLSMTLVALLLLAVVAPVATAEPVPTQQWDFKYSVPFVCGPAYDECEGVKPANYATAIKIHNPQTVFAYWRWKVVLLTPEPFRVTPFTGTKYMAANGGREVKCNHISQRFGYGWPLQVFMNGFVVIESDEALDVAAVYTVQDYYNYITSIDVEQFSPNAWYGHSP